MSDLVLKSRLSFGCDLLKLLVDQNWHQLLANGILIEIVCLYYHITPPQLNFSIPSHKSTQLDNQQFFQLLLTGTELFCSEEWSQASFEQLIELSEAQSSESWATIGMEQ